MPDYKYLCVGGGMTADVAVQGIRQVDQEGSIGLIGSESKPPYNRPPLSKGLWKGKPWRASGERPRLVTPRFTSAARLDPRTLRPLGFSYQKSRTIVEVAQAVCEGQLDLESLADLPDDEAVERLEQLRGVGRWTAEYVLLRGLGRWHLFPGDEVGAGNALTRWLRLKKPLDYQRVKRVLGRWKGYGGLIYFHLLLDRLAAAHLLP